VAYEDIYSRYNNLFNAQNNSLAQKRDSTIQQYQNQQKELENQYTDLANSLAAKETSTKGQYENLYKGLDQKNVEAKDKNYTDRNNVDVTVNQNRNRVQELMAKNGWLGGGANLQAQLSANNDRLTGFGNADTNLNQTLNTILQNRNTYQADEQNALNEIGNQRTSNDRERLTKLQNIIDAINSANSNYNADSQALRANLDAQSMAEIAQREEADRAYQRQVALASRSGSSGSSSSSNTTSGIRSITSGDIDGIVNSTTNTADKRAGLYALLKDLEGLKGEQATLLRNYTQKALERIRWDTEDTGVNNSSRRISGNAVY
jgi:hypothetical protein